MVLGFHKKECKQRARNGVWTGNYIVNPDKLVPVRLKSESVSIKWLKTVCLKKGVFANLRKIKPVGVGKKWKPPSNNEPAYVICIKDLFSAVEKEAEER